MMARGTLPLSPSCSLFRVGYEPKVRIVFPGIGAALHVASECGIAKEVKVTAGTLDYSSYKVARVNVTAELRQSRENVVAGWIPAEIYHSYFVFPYNHSSFPFHPHLAFLRVMALPI